MWYGPVEKIKVMKLNLIYLISVHKTMRKFRTFIKYKGSTNINSSIIDLIFQIFSFSCIIFAFPIYCNGELKKWMKKIILFQEARKTLQEESGAAPQPSDQAAPEPSEQASSASAASQPSNPRPVREGAHHPRHCAAASSSFAPQTGLAQPSSAAPNPPTTKPASTKASRAAGAKAGTTKSAKKPGAKKPAAKKPGAKKPPAKKSAAPAKKPPKVSGTAAAAKNDGFASPVIQLTDVARLRAALNEPGPSNAAQMKVAPVKRQQPLAGRRPAADARSTFLPKACPPSPRSKAAAMAMRAAAPTAAAPTAAKKKQLPTRTSPRKSTKKKWVHMHSFHTKYSYFLWWTKFENWT